VSSAVAVDVTHIRWLSCFSSVNFNEEVTVTLRLEDKKEIVAAVNQAASGAFSAVVADYRGLTVEQMTKLRSSARQQGVYLRVVRNTLARRAFEGTPFSILNDTLTGPTVIGLSLSEDDMGAAARLFKDFAKDNKKLEIKSAAFDGKLYGAEEIDVLANLPNLHSALTMLASVLQAPISKFGRLFTALKEKQEEAA
jgi:large subunit ribosomal protein L10